MKVLVYGAESFMGIHTIYRFYKDGYKVVGIYDKKHVEQASNTPHAKYVITQHENIEDILISERPAAVIYAKTQKIYTLKQAERKINELKDLLEATRKTGVSKLIYLSSTDVYDSEHTSENDAVMPESGNAKTNAICEQMVNIIRCDKQFNNVILRCSDIYGRYKEIEENDFLFSLIADISNCGAVSVNTNCNYAMIHCGDVADAIVRSISDAVEGTYNITPKQYISGEQIALEVAKCCNVTVSVGEYDSATAYTPQVLPPYKKAVEDFGFVCRGNFEKIVSESVRWYKEFQKAGEKPQKKKKNRYNAVVVTLQNVIVFAVLASIMLLNGKQLGILSINLMMLYIIVISTFFGINQGVFSAMLVSLFDVYYTTLQGYSLISALYDANILAQIVQNILIAVCIGYVVDKKDFIIGEKNQEIEHQQQEINYFTQLKHDLVLIKNEQEEKVLKYENGLGRIYTAIATLNTLAPKEVFFNSLLVIKDLVDEQDISLYIVQGEYGYMRRLVYIGQTPDKFPKTYKISENEKLFEIVHQKKFFSNSYLDEKFPSVIMPIVAQNKVIALIMVDHMSFERLTLYYMNTLEIIGRLLSDVYTKAMLYENIAKQSYYEENSCIITADNFKEVIQTAKNAALNSGLVYTMLCVDKQQQWKSPDISYTIRQLIRDNDEIGRLEYGDIGILLYSTNKDDSQYVIERFSKNGIDAVICNWL